MTGFEYKVVPAPMRGLKAKGIKGTQARFANALQTVMNELGAEGWEYQRTDTLPVEERQGLTGKTTTFQNMLVFRRVLEVQIPDDTEVAALNEDQTAVLKEPVEAEAGIDAFVEETAPEPDTVRLAADKRVNDTLDAPFVFPWNRRPTGKPAKDDSPHTAAE